jgi:putative lipoprotein
MRLPLANVIALAACAGAGPDTPVPAPAATPDQTGANVQVSGNVSYRQRVALPDSALVIVRIVDVSRADAPGEILGEARIPSAGRQVPIPFAIVVPASRVAANHSYAAQARIEYDGKLRWITTQRYPVLTRGAGNTAELRVDPVAD